MMESVFEILPTIFLRIPVWLTIWISGTLSIKYAIAALLNVRTEQTIQMKRLFRLGNR